MKTMLHEENGLRSGEAELLEHRRDHHCAEPHWISRDDHKRKLPRECATCESVIEAWMSNRRRILATYRVVEEIKWRDDENAPNGSNPENYRGKFHAHLGGDPLCAMHCTASEAGGR